MCYCTDDLRFCFHLCIQSLRNCFSAAEQLSGRFQFGARQKLILQDSALNCLNISIIIL